MKYSDCVNRAFKTLKLGALWGFVAGVSAATAAVYAVVLGGAAVVVGAEGFAEMGRVLSVMGTPSLSSFTPMLIMYGAFLLAALLSIPLSLIMHGGLVDLTDSAVAGRPVRVADGWSAGVRSMGRVLAIDFIIGLVVTLAFSVVMGMVVVLSVVMARVSGDGAAAAFGICFGLLFYLLAILAFVLLVTSYEALAVRYGVIGGRTFSDALSAALTAFRVRRKNVLVFALLALGLSIGYQMVTSAIMVPLQFLLSPSLMTGVGADDPSAMLRELPRLYAVLFPLGFLLAIPWSIFSHSLWTAFFRQLTGLETVVVTPAPPAPPTADA